MQWWLWLSASRFLQYLGFYLRDNLADAIYLPCKADRFSPSRMLSFHNIMLVAERPDARNSRMTSARFLPCSREDPPRDLQRNHTHRNPTCSGFILARQTTLPSPRSFGEPK